MFVTAYAIAQRFVGIKEVSGKTSNPAILAMLTLDQAWPTDDAVPWCSAFTNYIAWLLRLPRSKDLRARSWLQVGIPLTLVECRAGFDVVILKRGGSDAGPDVIAAPGHVGFFAGMGEQLDHVLLLGGNQSDSVSVEAFPITMVLGARRLLEE